jgi:hypothetical protein
LLLPTYSTLFRLLNVHKVAKFKYLVKKLTNLNYQKQIFTDGVAFLLVTVYRPV